MFFRINWQSSVYFSGMRRSPVKKGDISISKDTDANKTEKANDSHSPKTNTKSIHSSTKEKIQGHDGKTFSRKKNNGSTHKRTSSYVTEKVRVNRKSPRKSLPCDGKFLNDNSQNTTNVEKHYFPSRTRNFIVVTHKSPRDAKTDMSKEKVEDLKRVELSVSESCQKVRSHDGLKSVDSSQSSLTNEISVTHQRSTRSSVCVTSPKIASQEHTVKSVESPKLGPAGDNYMEHSPIVKEKGQHKETCHENAENTVFNAGDFNRKVVSPSNFVEDKRKLVKSTCAKVVASHSPKSVSKSVHESPCKQNQKDQQAKCSPRPILSEKNDIEGLSLLNHSQHISSPNLRLRRRGAAILDGNQVLSSPNKPYPLNGAHSVSLSPLVTHTVHGKSLSATLHTQVERDIHHATEVKSPSKANMDSAVIQNHGAKNSTRVEEYKKSIPSAHKTRLQSPSKTGSPSTATYSFRVRSPSGREAKDDACNIPLPSDAVKSPSKTKSPCTGAYSFRVRNPSGAESKTDTFDVPCQSVTMKSPSKLNSPSTPSYSFRVRTFSGLEAKSDTRDVSCHSVAAESANKLDTQNFGVRSLAAKSPSKNLLKKDINASPLHNAEMSSPTATKESGETVTSKCKVISPSHYQDHVLEASDFVDKIHRLRATNRRIQSVDEKVKVMSEGSPGSALTPRKASQSTDFKHTPKSSAGVQKAKKILKSVVRGERHMKRDKGSASPKFKTSPRFKRARMSGRVVKAVDTEDSDVDVFSDTNSSVEERKSCRNSKVVDMDDASVHGENVSLTEEKDDGQMAKERVEGMQISFEERKESTSGKDILAEKIKGSETNGSSIKEGNNSGKRRLSLRKSKSSKGCTGHDAPLDKVNIKDGQCPSKGSNKLKGEVVARHGRKHSGKVTKCDSEESANGKFVAIKRVDTVSFPDMSPNKHILTFAPGFELADPSTCLESDHKTPTKSRIGKRNSCTERGAKKFSPFMLKWQHAKGSTPNRRSKKVKLNQSWSLISDRSVAKLFSSEQDEANFEGFEPEEVQGESSIGSEISYVETKEIELEVNSDHEWCIEQEEEVAEDDGNLSVYLPNILSSPGRRSDSSWGDACVDYINSQLSTSKANSSMNLRSSPRKSPWKFKLLSPRKSPWKSQILSPRKSPWKMRMLSPVKSACVEFSAENDSCSARKRKCSQELSVPDQDVFLTPKRRKLRQSAGVTFLNGDGVEKVDEDIVFNHMSPHKLRQVSADEDRVISSSPVSGNNALRTSTPHGNHNTANRRRTRGKKSLNLSLETQNEEGVINDYPALSAGQHLKNCNDEINHVGSSSSVHFEGNSQDGQKRLKKRSSRSHSGKRK